MIYAWGHMEGTMKEKYPDIDYGVFATPTFTKGTPFAYDRYNGESTPGVNKNQSKEQQAVAQRVAAARQAQQQTATQPAKP